MEGDPTKMASKATEGSSRTNSERRAMVPDHELIRRVGEGAYGEVWLARNVMGTYRAVKIVYRSDFSRAEPYEREFSGIRKYEPISRTNESLVDILQIGRNDAEGYFYYVMELADDANAEFGTRNMESQKAESENGGGSSAQCPAFSPATYSARTLASDLKRHGRLPSTECVRIGLSLSQALGHLHGRNLLHRDIKPSNLIFVEGVPKLADIGLVAETTEARTFVGTEGFIPPEGPNSRQADLYSLGMVLYEISSGKKARDFPEPSPEMWRGRERAALLELNAVILKACAADPRQRYGSAEEMREELSWLQRGKSVMVRHTRRRLLAVAKRLILTVVLLTTVGLAGYWVAQRPNRFSGLPQRLGSNDAEFWAGGSGSVASRMFDVSPDGQRILFAGAKGLWLWEANSLMNRPFKLPGFGTFENPATNGGWEIPRVAGLPRWAPDGEHFVFQARKEIGGSKEGPLLAWALFLVNRETGEWRQITSDLPETGRIRDMCWLPDGKGLTYVDHERHLYTVSLVGGRTLWVDAVLPDGNHFMLGGYSRDGNWLLLCSAKDPSRDTDIWLMPHFGGRAVPVAQRPGTDACPTWGPNGESVFFVSNGGHRLGNSWGLWEVRIDLKTGLPKGESRNVFMRPAQKVHHPKFVGGGQRLVYAIDQPDTTILLATGHEMDRFVPLFRGGGKPVLAPDGQTIYFIGEQRDQQGVYAMDRSGKGGPRKLTHLVPLSDGITRGGLSLSSDGERIALLSYDENQKRFGVFVVPTSGGTATLIHELAEFEVALPVWSPDGQWLAFTVDQALYRVSRDGKVRETLATLYKWQGWSARWSPDGKHIAALAYASPEEWEEKAGVFVVDVAEKTWRKLTPDSEDQYKEGLEWHPSGEYVTYMFYGPEKDSAQIRRAYLDGRPTDLMIDQENHWDYVGVWAPDARWFVFTSGHCQGPGSNLHGYDARTRAITHGMGGGSLPVWSHDGKTVVRTSGTSERWFEELENVH